MIQELTESLAQVRSLRGLLPICSSCKKIRDEKGRWPPGDLHLRSFPGRVSHSICPSCAQSLYSEFMDNGREQP